MDKSYKRLGLCKNPFVAEQFPGTSDELFIDRNFPEPPTSSQNTFIQLIGDKGAGKTSLLLFWKKRFPAPYVHIGPGIKRVRFIPIKRISYWDEADRIPKFILWIALKIAHLKKSTIVAATHTDLSKYAKRAGLKVINYQFRQISTYELEQWIKKRIQYYSTGEVKLFANKELINRVASQSEGSWRKVGDMMHIWVSEEVRANERISSI